MIFFLISPLYTLHTAALPSSSGCRCVQSEDLMHHHVHVRQALHHRVGGEGPRRLLKGPVHLLLKLGLYLLVPGEYTLPSYTML